MLDYKIEKKADGWYVAGERFSNQTSATRYLSALFTGKATPKKAAASAPKKAAPKKAAEKEWGVMVGAGRVKMPVAPKRPVASRVKMPVTPKKAAPKKAAEKEWGVMVGAGRVKIGVRDAFPVLRAIKPTPGSPPAPRSTPFSERALPVGGGVGSIASRIKSYYRVVAEEIYMKNRHDPERLLNFYGGLISERAVALYLINSGGVSKADATLLRKALDSSDPQNAHGGGLDINEDMVNLLRL